MARLQKTNFLNFVKAYRAPLALLSLVFGIVILDYTFRHTFGSFYDRGVRALNDGNVDRAILHFNRALRHQASDPTARAALALAYQRKGWGDEALKQFEQAIRESQATLVQSYFNSGVVLQAKKNPSAAEQFYHKALALDPTHSDSNLNLGQMALNKGGFKLALQYFERALKSEPRSTNALYGAGYANERLGNKKEAKKYYLSTLNAAPDHPEAKKRLSGLN